MGLGCRTCSTRRRASTSGYAEGFDFWLAEDAEQTDDVRESMERANASVIPTERLASVESAYWCRIGDRSHLRWVLPHDEEPLLDAIARLHARGGSNLGEGTRYIGAFRAHGLLVPVWDLAPGARRGRRGGTRPGLRRTARRGARRDRAT